MGCPTVTIKYFVIIFNSLCALFGIGTIVVTSIVLQNVTDVGRLVCIFMIVLGCIAFVISFVGCCGAVRENNYFIWTYVAFLLILIAANAVLIFGYMSNIDGEKHAKQTMDNAWALQMNGTDVMSLYQNMLHCCGKTSAQDYVSAHLSIPISCYQNGDNSTVDNLYADGCVMKLMIAYKKSEKLVVIFSWITLAVETAALVCACILAITFRNEERRARY